MSAFQLWLEALPHRDCQIFRRRNFGEKLWNFLVEEAMIHGVEHLAVHDFLELLEVDHKSRARIDFALHRDFERVVVAVSVRIVALAEDALVFFRREVGIMVVMRGGEFGFAG